MASVPVLCGFVPSESLVVISLHGPRGRIGLTMRFDLAAWPEVEQAGDEVAARLAHDGATSTALVLYTEAPPELSPGGSEPALLAAVRAACADRGIATAESLLVRAGRWHCCQCSGGPSCPLEGVPLEGFSSPAVDLLGAASALDGRAVLASREELVQSVAPPAFLAAATARQLAARTVDGWIERHERDGSEAMRVQGLAVARAALEHSQAPGGIGMPEAVRLAVTLGDVRVRDEVITWALTCPDELMSLLLQTVRQVVPPVDTPACTLLAWLAYAGGDGGLANVALQRALGTDPDYSLARLIQQSLDAQIAPSQMRGLMHEAWRVRDARVRRPG